MSVFGYVNDNDESLKSKTGGKFGLNSAFITKVEYNPNGGTDGAAADCVDITVAVGDKEFRSRIFDATGELFKGEDKVQPGEEGYQAVYESEMMQRMAVITHAIKAVGVTDDQLKQALATPPTDFKGWAEIVTSLVPDNFSTRPVDVFLEYQWNIKGDNDRTFLQLPANMKGGRFLSPAVTPNVGTWTEVRDANGLHYVDDAGNKHPFDRSANYMEGNKANQQFANGSQETGAAIQGNTPTPAKNGAW